MNMNELRYLVELRKNFYDAMGIIKDGVDPETWEISDNDYFEDAYFYVEVLEEQIKELTKQLKNGEILELNSIYNITPEALKILSSNAILRQALKQIFRILDDKFNLSSKPIVVRAGKEEIFMICNNGCLDDSSDFYKEWKKTSTYTKVYDKITMVI